jgi:hypothetical protein
VYYGTIAKSMFLGTVNIAIVIRIKEGAAKIDGS